MKYHFQEMVKAQLFETSEHAYEPDPVPRSLPSLPAAALASTIVPAGETPSSPCLYPEEPAQGAEPAPSASSERSDPPPDIPTPSTAPEAAPAACTASPSQEDPAQDPAAVMAGRLRAAAEAAIAAGAFPSEEPEPDCSKEQFDTPYSMSRGELRSMRNTLELGIARMALMTRWALSYLSVEGGAAPVLVIQETLLKTYC